jgi:subtilisin family serine protease
MVRSKRFVQILLLGVYVLSALTVYADGVRRVKEKIPNSYIVLLKPGHGAQDVGSETANSHSGKVTAVMSHLDMFAITLPNEMAAEATARDPRVLLVQENAVLRVADCRTLDPGGSQWALAHLNDPSWTADFGAKIGNYLNWVSVYVIDSKINSWSNDFSYPNGGNKIREVADFAPGCTDPGGDRPPFKVGGGINHGGAVASIIAGNVHGIVPNLNAVYSIVAVDCLGASSDEALGRSADYVIQNHQAGAATVANISIATTFPDAIFDAAVQRMVANGIFVAAAAGNGQNNSALDACATSPAELGGSARTAGFMAVGATNIYGSRTGYSNYGACVDIYAPGGETNPYDSYDKGVMTSEGAVTGTSFAAPHVAGAAVVIYSRYPYWSASSVWSQIKYDSAPIWGLLMLRIPTDGSCIVRCYSCGPPPVSQ